MPDTSTVMRVHVEHRMFVAFDPRHPVGPHSTTSQPTPTSSSRA
jgi:hypothetical protein